MPSVVFHLEDPHRFGITISMLDPWRLLWESIGIREFEMIDMTTDGHFGGMGDAACRRHRSLDTFAPKWPVVAFETTGSIPLSGFVHPIECHYVFGPSMGFAPRDHTDWTWVRIPMFGIETRDAGAIVAAHRLWQLR